jgi:hypothetical protein
VRSEERQAAVRIDRYEFKTRSANGLAAGAGLAMVSWQEVGR